MAFWCPSRFTEPAPLNNPDLRIWFTKRAWKITYSAGAVRREGLYAPIPRSGYFRYTIGGRKPNKTIPGVTRLTKVREALWSPVLRRRSITPGINAWENCRKLNDPVTKCVFDTHWAGAFLARLRGVQTKNNNIITIKALVKLLRESPERMIHPGAKL